MRLFLGRAVSGSYRMTRGNGLTLFCGLLVALQPQSSVCMPLSASRLNWGGMRLLLALQSCSQICWPPPFQAGPSHREVDVNM